MTKSMIVCAVAVFLASAGIAAAEDVEKQMPSIETNFPLAKIAGSSGKEVEVVLGEAKWEKTKYGPKGVYLDGAVEVVFIKDKADWITVYPTKDLAFKASAIRAYLELADRRPNFGNSYTIRWEKKDGYLQIQAIPKQKKKSAVDMLYIKTATE